MLGIDQAATPFIDYFELLGYKAESKNGCKIFKHFSGVEDELIALYEGIGLRDLSSANILELRGKDVLNFLNRITTNSIIEMPKDGITNTVFATDKGRIIDTASLINLGDFQILLGSSQYKLKIISWIEKYIIGDDVKVNDSKGRYAFFELVGPQADSFITLLSGNIVNDIQPNTIKVMSSEGMIFFLAKVMAENNMIKFWLIADLLNGKELIRYLVENKGPFNFHLIGEEAYNIYRVEQGIPAVPNEINDHYNPHEANILNMVSFNKGCYIGQEVIARLDTYNKAQKQLTGIMFSEKIDTNSTFVLYDKDDIEAGNITSAVYSFKLNKFIGLAYIKKMYIEPGTKLKAKSEKKIMVDITVESLPFRK